MTLKLSQLSNTRMDVELLKFINADMKWNVMRKGRTSLTRRPRKPGAGSFELVCSVHEPTVFESKKAVDGSSKKRRLLRQSTLTPSKAPCIKGEQGTPPGPQTPSVCYEDFGQRCWSGSLPKFQKAKSKSRVRNGKTKKTKKGALNLDDFSGIALLADVACDVFVQEAAYRVQDFMSKEHTKPEVKIVNACSLDIKEGIVSPGSNASAVQQNVNDIGAEVEEKKVAPSKGLRLHWDLNTVMDDWEDPCDDMQIESVKPPLLETCNVSSEKTYAKAVTVKTSDGESSGSKSEVVDSSTHPAKCEDFLTSPTSVLKEQNIACCETETIDGLKLDQQPVSEEVTTENHVVEGCGSNVTHEEHGHMAEADLEDKIQVDYDSPFEDGELREPIENPESDNIYTDEFGSIENSLLGKVDLGQTVDDRNLLLVKNKTDQGVPVNEGTRTDEPEKDISERKELHIDESTSFDVCRDGEYLHRSRSSNIGDFTIRDYDLKSNRGLDRNYSRNYNSRGGGYRTQDRRPSPPERNTGYGSYRGPPSARSQSRDRFRYHSQEYHDSKPHFTPSFSRPVAQPRSRSGSPIAWNFQKRKNLDTSESGEIKTGHASPERSSKCFKDGQFRDKRQASVTQRYDTIGYSEKLKPDDYFRFSQRSARFSQASSYKYKDNDDEFRKHDGYYDKVKRVGGSADGARRFRYAHNRE